MRRFFKENSLSIVFFMLFLLTLVGQAVAGYAADAEDRRDHDEAPLPFAAYLGSGHFVSATFENWESEFLQMSAFVLLTIFLRQKGSPDSKKIDEKEDVDEDPRKASDKSDAPGPVRSGGLALRIYEHSLSLALVLLFLGSYVVHLYGSLRHHNDEALAHGQAPATLGEHLGSAQMWFESFQNWQSEFFSVGALIVLQIFLRQRGSPESKPVAAPHDETGH